MASFADVLLALAVLALVGMLSYFKFDGDLTFNLPFSYYKEYSYRICADYENPDDVSSRCTNYIYNVQRGKIDVDNHVAWFINDREIQTNKCTKLNDSNFICPSL